MTLVWRLQRTCTVVAPFFQTVYLYIILLLAEKTRAGLLGAAAVKISFQPAFLTSSPVFPQLVAFACMQPATPPPFLPVHRVYVMLAGYGNVNRKPH
ncbi:MAG: hypothetical protein LBS79_02710 [Tannerella sp.]|nr:hypothetical protein [Tannerella sp.]